MKKKRSLWITLAAVACICVSMLFGSAATAKAEGEGQEYTYTDATLCVCGADGVVTAYAGDRNVKEIVVPQTIGGVTVTGIGAEVF